ncbi:enoyl-CoA hydratase/isomerase family protein [Aquabacterium sp.]|uniref:enoyl-CoA hydratase/isomerase family protein n=1 Tax=Aquabacterium sp. TaxID=1872578 RepID=UPI002C37AC10|nr:enoyl-CoA hydratase-related protein [Aquabacterium sp.]HSW06038.1 enoyl-CoA hydratase-related protein [Aquabacterium sp.]
MSIQLSTDGAVGILTLQRPEKKNAMLLAMRDELAALCEQINDRPEIRAVVLTGAGTDFCAGADIGEMGMGGLNGSFLRARHMHKLIRALARVQKPMIAATRGVAVGMGFSMALAADLIIASETTRFSQIQRKIALPPDAGGAWFLVRHLGVAKAKDLAFSARMVGAVEAAELGFVHKVVPDAALMDEALALAHEYAAAPTIAMGLAKRMFDVAATMTLDQFMDLEGSMLPLAVQAEDFREGTQAFKDKRAAKFTGH